ncbi:histidine kinase N-terminal 7TM domain-containing protein [Haloarchaeobius sp. DFWS5]|uniref:histidine kinase N-terminal 7TM domain-containing protein n=1 Tax=Haloarchaeobius sp. DFWS5 TaxID=3446114 RepID=UPI003EBB2AA2
MEGVPWPAVGSLVAAVANLYFFQQLSKYREQPGVRWFRLVIGAQVALCLSQGVALLVYDRLLRLALESLFFVTGSVILVGYFAFAATYTGRGHLVQTVWFKLLGLVAAAISILAVTNPLHHLVWSDFRIDPVLNAATVSYIHEPLIRFQFVGIVLVSLLGMSLLFDTVVSYGPLYRKQAIAVALTPIPPAAAFAVWTLHLGPYPQLNLVPLMFLPHAALDMYALFRSDMFEFNPATRRTGERAAIDDLGSPVVVVDEKGRIVTLNARAQVLFGVDKRTALTRPLAEFVDFGDLDSDGFERTITTTERGRTATYKLTAKPLYDVVDTHVGYTVLLQDLTEEIRRKQRLTVLNRVLRHNLRNDLTVVLGTLEVATDRVDDEATETLLTTAIAEAEGLVDLGEKARQVEQTMAEDATETEPVVVTDLLTDIVDSLDVPADAAITVDVPAEATVQTNGALLSLAFSNLLENAIEHHDGPAPQVTVGLASDRAVADSRAGTPDGDERATPSIGTDGGTVTTFEVHDDGPGIPEHELRPLESGEETPLEHGSGLGLWVVTWAIGSLGGDLSFETGADGTTVSITLPTRSVDAVSKDDYDTDSGSQASP